MATPKTTRTHTKVALTTVDNPFDPFDAFDQWYSWDTSHGYHTTSLLARLAVVSNELSEASYDHEVSLVIDEIVSENVSGVHRKVTKKI